MILDISTLRKEYSSESLDLDTIPKNPFELFTKWIQEAIQSEIYEPNAMCLSTCDPNTLQPSSRIVLLKAVNDSGFVWFTNYESRKGLELEMNPNASLVFWWGPLERSVRVEGRVEKVNEKENDSYFYSRPLLSQLGALSSDQSRVIESRELLDEKLAALKSEFGVGNEKFESSSEKKPKRPSHWGGYRLVPSRFEFWKGRESRLHDRIEYSVSDSTSEWKKVRLQP